MKNLVTTNFTLWVLYLATGVPVLKMSHYRHKRKWLTTFQDSAHSVRVSFVIDFTPLAYCPARVRRMFKLRRSEHGCQQRAG
jgi:hypothetical protein